MDIKEAYGILKEKGIRKKPKKCIEFKSCFVFQLGEDDELDALRAVDKDSKKAHAFIPTMISSDECNNPIKVYNFK